MFTILFNLSFQWELSSETLIKLRRGERWDFMFWTLQLSNFTSKRRFCATNNITYFYFNFVVGVNWKPNLNKSNIRHRYYIKKKKSRKISPKALQGLAGLSEWHRDMKTSNVKCCRAILWLLFRLVFEQQMDVTNSLSNLQNDRET